MSDHRRLSYWHDSVADAGDALERRAGLDGDTDADIAIVGGGLTGLWTAWYLLQREPGARILVLEKEVAGFGVGEDLAKDIADLMDGREPFEDRDKAPVFALGGLGFDDVVVQIVGPVARRDRKQFGPGRMDEYAT